MEALNINLEIESRDLECSLAFQIFRPLSSYHTNISSVRIATGFEQQFPTPQGVAAVSESAFALPQIPGRYVLEYKIQ